MRTARIEKISNRITATVKANTPTIKIDWAYLSKLSKLTFRIEANKNDNTAMYCNTADTLSRFSCVNFNLIIALFNSLDEQMVDVNSYQNDAPASYEML